MYNFQYLSACIAYIYAMLIRYDSAKPKSLDTTIPYSYYIY